ncbi:MAG: hypothetical protein KA444_06660 [Bacteroidia bacterium]|nr:hypothetical protein [Bacteroidia bacterium]
MITGRETDIYNDTEIFSTDSTHVFLNTPGSFHSKILCVFTLLLLICIQGYSQKNRLKAFCKLSKPEKCWILTHPLIANKAWKITQHVRLTTASLAKDSTLDGEIDGGQLDAFRHTYWMACLSQRMKWKKALRLGNAHEKGNYDMYKENKLEEHSLPDSIASVMDHFNNNLGSEIGRKNREVSQDSIRIMVIQAILNGEARIFSRNEKGEFLDCEGRILNMQQFSGFWNIPKCLVPSNRAVYKTSP